MMPRSSALVVLAIATACSNSGDAGVDANPALTDATTGADADTTAPLRTLVVNEVAAAGDPEDWIEVVNATTSPIELSEYVFVDLAGELDKARPLAAGTLGPGERHVQEASDAANGFKFGSDEEVWVYRAADGRLSDGIDWAEGASPSGGSYARQPDIFGGFVTVTSDTRGTPNQ